MNELPKTMKAMVLEGHGDMDKLVWHEDWPLPVPQGAEVLIKVLACGLNNTDVNTRSGWYSKSVEAATTGAAYDEVSDDDPTWGGAPISFPRIQGADIAGVVVRCGPDANSALLSKRVISDNWLRDWDNPLNKDNIGYLGSECNGGFAEYTTIDYRNVAAVESDLTDAELATFSCSYSTAEGMLNRAQVSSNDTVLVTGASGGVGSALIQLAKRRGAKVVAMASEAKHDAVSKLAPDAILSRNPANLKAALKVAIGQETVNVVADIVGGDYFPTIIDVLSRGGRYTCSGAIAGPMVFVDLRTFYLRDLTFTGSTVIPPQVFTDLVSYIEKGEIRPLVAATYPLKDLHAAQQAFIDKKHMGNIVVCP
jgi:NADPH:quinone reductase-like Zn-dependent oxidoreductase